MMPVAEKKMPNVPDVSVVVPSYNSGEFIVETIQSILTQNVKNIEVLVVDDCSKDDTIKKVKELKLDCIVTIALENNHGGPSRPRSEGAKIARGRYVAFCDSDDILLKSSLEDAIDFMERVPSVAMVFSDAMKFKGECEFNKKTFLSDYHNFNKLKKNNIGGSCFVIDSDSAYNALFFENYILNPGCVVVRKEIFAKVGYFDETLKNADDWDLWLRIAKVFPVGFIDKVALHYRVRGGSISARGAANSENRIKVLRKHLNKDLPEDVQRQIRTLISKNYLSAGYASQIGGNRQAARVYYCASLQERWSIRGVKGVFVSFLHPKLYVALKRVLSPVPEPGRGL